MDTYKVVFKEGETEGVYAVSLVEEPAIGVEFVALSKQAEVKLATVSEEKRILLGAILIPDLPIYRRKDDKEFNILFDAQTIKQVQENFAKNGYLNNSTIEHNGENIEGVTFVESWIKEDEQHDKSVKFGLNEPIGTWYMAMKVNNDDIWNEYVKTGKVKGFSIDGVFDLQKINLSSDMNLESIVNAIKEGFASLKLSETPTDNTEVKLSEGLLADGTTKVMAESFEVGQAVFVVAEDGSQVPAPAGEHTLQSGATIVVDDAGMITEVKEKVEATSTTVEMSKDEVKEFIANLATVEIPAELEVIRKAVQILFNDRFSWEIQQKERESLLNEFMPKVATTMAKEVGKQIQSVKTELKAEIEKSKPAEPVKSATKANPEVVAQSVNLKKMSKKEQIAFNLKNLK